MSKLKAVLKWGILVLVIVVAGAYMWLRSSLPQTEGTIELAGLTESVTVARDEYGVPHISAANATDLYFAMGFVHAQDRLFQMEMNRRIGHGRVAEITGEAALSIDKYMRTLGFNRKAASAYRALPAETKSMLEAYASGVNAYLKNRTGALPPEFVILGFEPEPWKPVDTLVWQKLMWMDLSGNMRHELARAQLFANLTPTQIESLYPTYPGETELPLPDLKDILANTPIEDTVAIVGPEKPAGYGSNNWVISGELTKSGKPLLANDPHLGLTTPSIWYLVRMHQRDTGTNLVGVGFPGSPSIVLGRNDTIAWGFTNTAPDIQDLFIEKLIDENTYLTPDGPAKFTVIPERIKIRGKADHIINVRETRHGPVISDANTVAEKVTDHLAGENYVLSLQWTALEDTDTAPQVLASLPYTKTFEEFKQAGQAYMGPEQNMIYADTSGNIGYHAPALVPIRHPENEIGGRLPSPGWIAKYDWQGYIPANEMPARFNPAGGIIATANEKVVGENYPYYITRDWSLPYRGNRIRDQLAAKAPHDTASFAKLQFDTVSDMLRDVKPWLVKLLPEGEIKNTLNTWNGDMIIEAPEPLIIQTLLMNYQNLLIADELGSLSSTFTRLRPRLLKSTLYHAAGAGSDDAYYALPAEDHSAWCDNVKTEGITETCAGLVAQAYEMAIEDLSAQYGDDWRNWQWGEAHVLHQTHRPFSNIGFLKRFFELSAPQGGGRYTINVAGDRANPGSRHKSGFGASYRGIFDLSDLDNSLYVQPTGQSGNPLSVHFDDLFGLWQKGEYFTIPTNKVIPDNAIGILTLAPANVN